MTDFGIKSEHHKVHEDWIGQRPVALVLRYVGGSTQKAMNLKVKIGPVP